MKYIIVIIWSMFSFSGFSQSQEVVKNDQSLVLIEEFVNVSCIPCVKEVDSFEELVNKDDNIILMRYHLGVPGKDPFYETSKEDIDLRDKYYNVEYLPSIYINGNVVEGDYYPGAPANLTNAQIVNERLAINEFQYPFELSYDYSSAVDSILVKIKPEFDLSILGKRLFVAVVEKEVKFTSPPGNNGKKVFHNIFRKFVTPNNGISLPDLKTKMGLNTEAEWSIPIPEVNDIREIKIIAFIIDEEFGKILEVEQSNIEIVFDESKLLDLKIDGTILNQKKCESQKEMLFTFTNSGEQVINSFTYEIEVNDTMMSYGIDAVSLSKGESFEVKHDDIFLEPGGNDLKVSIKSVNTYQNGDHYLGNNVFEEQLAYFEKEAQLINEDFEGYEFEDEGPFTDFSTYKPSISKVSGKDFGYPDIKLGAFAKSESSVMVDFYTWDMENYDGLSTMEYGEMDLSSLDRPTLVFDYTSASNAYDGDRMTIKISTDCGDSSRAIKVFDGDLLNTTATRSDFYIPTPSDTWETARVDLSEYKNQKVVLGFEFKSGFGNNLFLDNIRIENSTSTSTTIEDVYKINIYPNPVVNNLNLDLPKAGEIIVKNIYGKILLRKQFKSGKSSIDVTDLKSGTYIIQYNMLNDKVVKKIIIL